MRRYNVYIMINRFFLLLLLMSVLLSAAAEQIPENYYDAINGKKGEVLKGTLKTVIRPHTVIAYGSGNPSSWYVFYYSDRDENGY